jgi:hypothetical protein
MRRLARPAWLLRHAIALALVAGCLAAGWWQIGRAAGGNMLSFGYAIEWPFFAAFVVFMWVREMRLALRADRPPSAPADLAAHDQATSRGPGIKSFDVAAALHRRAESDRAALEREATGRG